MGLILVIVVLFIYRVRDVLIPFVFGFMIAYILEPLVDILEKRHIPRGPAIIMVFLLIIGALGMLLFFVLPVLMQDLTEMMALIPQYAQTTEETIQEMQLGYHRTALPDSVRQVIDQTIAHLEGKVLEVIQGMAKGVVLILGQVFNLILAPILSYYFLKESHLIGAIILKMIPVRYRPEVTLVGGEISKVIRNFIRGNLLVALLVAVLATLGMALIGMDFPFLIGIIVGITNFIPYFGAVIAAIPALFLALLKSPWMALSVLGVMLIIQQLEGNIISPKVIGECVDLHPLTLIFALLVGGELWGISGMIFSVPLAAIMKILIKRLYLHLI